jgi:hypothetical protein
MASYMPTLAAQGFQTGGASGTGIIVASDVFKIAVYTGTVPTASRDATTQTYGGATMGTEASGTNYTAGGLAVTIAASQPAIYTTGGVHYATVGAAAANVSWANVTLTSVTYAVLYDSTTTIKYAIAVYDFGGTQTVTANTFQINFTSAYPSNTLWYLSCN